MKTPEAIPEAAVPVTPGHPVEAMGAALGAVGGAATGAAMAGPLGAIAGAVIGAAMGASSGWAADKHSQEEASAEAELDEEIGVGGGPIGVPGLRHPPSKVAAPSAAALGIASDSGSADAEGPMQSPPE